MIRKDREVTDSDGILDILERCETLRVAINGNDCPYVFPISFGYESTNGKTTVYFHCAKRGLKVDLIGQGASVCVEGDVFWGFDPIKHGITTRYESIIGFGLCEPVDDPDERVKGLNLLCDHCGLGGYDITDCSSLQATLVYRISLDSITGKRNLPKPAQLPKLQADA